MLEKGTRFRTKPVSPSGTARIGRRARRPPGPVCRPLRCNRYGCGKTIRMELLAIPLEIPEGGNIILGQTHFIKSVEDLYEAIVNTVPQMKFGIAFNEASGACLTRCEGNDETLKALAVRNAQAIGAGHTFVIVLKEGYPINVLNRIKDVPEVCSIFCATANPVEVIVAQSAQGRGVLGVIDGSSPKGVEGPADAEWRHGLLRKIGYKR
jgi:adenosine/AMP kinase